MNFEFDQCLAFTPLIQTEEWGRMGIAGLNGMGARLTADTRCQNCGGTFKSGDKLEADLRENWDEAPWRHRTTCPPVGNQP